MSRHRAAQRPDRSQKKRTPLGARNRLTFKNLDEDYHYHVISDTDDRLSLALEGGYEFVTSDEKLGDERVAEASTIGAHVSKPVGGGTTGYLMRIPKAWYDEDQAEKQRKIDETERAIRPDPKKNQYGKGVTDD